MAVSHITVTLAAPVQKVWETVTALDAYAWRSDLRAVRVMNETQFVEYAKDGFATTFTVTCTEPYRRWEFDLENANMHGHWVGVFTPKGTQTEITFTEDVTAKKRLMKPFVKPFLKKQQAQYVADLKKALEV